jgi:hypothetical protein
MTGTGSLTKKRLFSSRHRPSPTLEISSSSASIWLQVAALRTSIAHRPLKMANFQEAATDGTRFDLCHVARTQRRRDSRLVAADPATRAVAEHADSRALPGSVVGSQRSLRLPTALGNALATVRMTQQAGPAGIQPIGVAHRRPSRQHAARWLRVARSCGAMCKPRGIRLAHARQAHTTPTRCQLTPFSATEVLRLHHAASPLARKVVISQVLLCRDSDLQKLVPLTCPR